MELGIGKTLFPDWSAALTLVKDHGIDAAVSARNAATSGDVAARLDNAVLALTSFDHAIDNTRKLPVQWLVPRSQVYYRGYEAAKQAVTLLVSSGVIPGAKERVGRATLTAAKDAFQAGVAVSQTETGKYGRRLASGWLEATAEDALTAVRMLSSGDTGRDLLAGINQARQAADRGVIDAWLVTAVNALFDKASAQLSAAIPAFRPTQVDPSLIQRTNVLLAQVEQSARVLVADADAATKHVQAG